jgi:hypothetical protein
VYAPTTEHRFPLSLEPTSFARRSRWCIMISRRYLRICTTVYNLVLSLSLLSLISLSLRWGVHIVRTYSTVHTFTPTACALSLSLGVGFKRGIPLSWSLGGEGEGEGGSSESPTIARVLLSAILLRNGSDVCCALRHGLGVDFHIQWIHVHVSILSRMWGWIFPLCRVL